MPKTTSANIDTDGLAKIIHDFPHHEFIFQYNDNTKAAIEKMHNTGAKFSLLFDASGVAKRKIISTCYSRACVVTTLC